MARVGFFPSPYRDELFYSVVTRFHRKSHNYSKKITLKDLELKKVLRMDICQGIEPLMEILKLYKYKSFEEVLNEHTFHNYYKNVLGIEYTNTLVYTKNTHEFKKNGFVNNSHLKFCLKCFELEDEQYWHLSHNLPGVNYCLIHEEFLVDTNIEFNKQDFISLSLEIVKASPQKMPNNIELHRRIAIQSLMILEIDISELELRKIYLQKLYEKSYIVEGFLSNKAFEEDFLKFFGESFFEELGLPGTWIVHELYWYLISYSKRTSPLNCILMHIFLGIEWEDLFSISFSESFLGINLKERIKCSNLFCKKYNKNIPEYRYHIGNNKITINFKCKDCNYEEAFKLSNSENPILLNEGINCWDYIIYSVEKKYLTIEQLSLKFDIPKIEIKKYIENRPIIYRDY